MILTTKQQAQNFALWALSSSEFFDDLNHEAMVGGLMSEVTNVFGKHTFSDDDLTDLVETAIKIYDQNY